MKKVTLTLTTLAALAAAPAAFAQATPTNGDASHAQGTATGQMGTTTTPAAQTGTTTTPSAQTPAPATQPIQTTQQPLQTTQTSTVGTTTVTQADITPMPATSTQPRERETITLKQSFRPNRPLLYTGGALFLGSYVTTVALTAAKVDDPNDKGDRTMYIPVVGPWLHLADIKETGTDLALTIGSGVLQGAGIGLAAASLFVPEKVPAATIQAGNVKMNVLPTTYASGGGVGAVGQF